jgi:UDP-3-O-[3-hydroxymyristoyl] glucosamine N-acyltransferase
MSKSYTLSEIAVLVSGELSGEPDKKITGVNTIDEANEDEIVYLQNKKYFKKFERTRAAAALIPPGHSFKKIATITVDRPKLAFAKVVQAYHPLLPAAVKGIHESAVVDETAVLERDVSIGPYTVVGKDVRLGVGVVVGPMCCIGDSVEIGDGSYIFQGVQVREDVTIGKNCIIHPGAVLGSDGFGFETDEQGRHVKIPQVGKLVLMSR